MELRSGTIYPTFRFWLDNGPFPVGSQGPPGEPGPGGPPGPQGVQGVVGSTGPQGVQGGQGIQGVQGPIGLTGLTGPQGIQGDQGIQGPVGMPGSQGVQGDLGIQGPAGVPKIGDVKMAFSYVDHDGWVQLNGRPKSSLNASQQVNATSLGIGLTLPDADGKYLSSSGGDFGSQVGSNTFLLPASSLPNVTLTGTTVSSGAHTHTVTYSINPQASGSIRIQGGAFPTPSIDGSPAATSSSGAHTHAFTTSSLNGNVTQTSIPMRPATFNVGVFLFLGI